MTNYTGLLLTIITSLNRYVVRRDQVAEIRMILKPADLERPDERGKLLQGVELGPLLDPFDLRSNARRHALVVPTRRKSVALLVERVVDLNCETLDLVQPMPKVLAKRLTRPWFLGALIQAEGKEPLLVLDLRQIAQDVLMRQVIWPVETV